MLLPLHSTFSPSMVTMALRLLPGDDAVVRGGRDAAVLDRGLAHCALAGRVPPDLGLLAARLARQRQPLRVQFQQ